MEWGKVSACILHFNMVIFIEMRAALKLFLITIFLLGLFFASPALSLEIKDRNEYLIDVRSDDGDIYLNRFSVHKKIDSLDLDINGFSEVQWNFDTSEWEKMVAGLEAQKILWNYIYASQSIQYISGQMLDYMAFGPDSNSIDATTNIGFYVPFYKNFILQLVEQFSVNLERGRAEYCEMIAEVTYDFKDSYSFGIGWRHTDRIHAFDSDYVTVSLELKF